MFFMCWDVFFFGFLWSLVCLQGFMFLPSFSRAFLGLFEVSLGFRRVFQDLEDAVY